MSSAAWRYEARPPTAVELCSSLQTTADLSRAVVGARTFVLPSSPSSPPSSLAVAAQALAREASRCPPVVTLWTSQPSALGGEVYPSPLPAPLDRQDQSFSSLPSPPLFPPFVYPPLPDRSLSLSPPALSLPGPLSPPPLFSIPLLLWRPPHFSLPPLFSAPPRSLPFAVICQFSPLLSSTSLYCIYFFYSLFLCYSVHSFCCVRVRVREVIRIGLRLGLELGLRLG